MHTATTRACSATLLLLQHMADLAIAAAGVLACDQDAALLRNMTILANAITEGLQNDVFIFLLPLPG